MIISVVIPTMDKAALLGRTLDALAVQEIAPEVSWEVVVVDDGSGDGTAQLLSERAVAFPVPLKIVSPGRNVGRARARNLGAEAAQGDWLLFLDDDIIAPPGLVSAHLDVLQGRADRGVIGYAVTDPDLIDGPHFHYLDTRGVARLEPGLAPARFFVTQNASVPRQAFLAVGGFHEAFTGYGFEDMEVAFRLEDEVGVTFIALTSPVPRHIHHHSLADYLDKKRECGRHSLPLLAGLHPGRLPEMRLHHIVDTVERPDPSVFARLLRHLAVSPLGVSLPGMMDSWPTSVAHRPRFFGLYQRLMNLVVLFCYSQGLSDPTEKAEKKT